MRTIAHLARFRLFWLTLVLLLGGISLVACRAPAPAGTPGVATLPSTAAAYPINQSATPAPQGYPAATLGPNMTPPPINVPTLRPLSTYIVYIPLVSAPISSPTPPPPATPLPPTPTLAWPDPLTGQTASKLGLHVVRNEDPYVLEFVRRVHPRVIKGLDDVGWLAEVKAASPGTVTVGRLNSAAANAQETWPDTTDPVAAAEAYVSTFLDVYQRNPNVDYWEGWNEFVPVTTARGKWYAQFEATRACTMQAHGLRAAVGGFAAGTLEYTEMEVFLPALEAAHRCGGLFTLHEVVMPIIGCGLGVNEPELIPGAPALSVPAGSIMLRYRFWYEGYLKPRGLGDLPLVVSELAVGGIKPGSPCNGPGGAGWKGYRDWWVQQGVGPTGPQAYVNVLAWYDSEIRKDPYVIGAAIFTAGAISQELGWTDSDVHDAIVPLAIYEAGQP